MITDWTTIHGPAIHRVKEPLQCLNEGILAALRDTTVADLATVPNPSGLDRSERLVSIRP